MSVQFKNDKPFKVKQKLKKDYALIKKETKHSKREDGPFSGRAFGRPLARRPPICKPREAVTFQPE
jgi:hypothetical protein